MKQIKPNKRKFPKINKNKVIFWLVLSLIVIFGSAYLFYQILKGINAWFEVNEFVFNKPVTVTLKKPIEIKEKQIPVAEVIRVVEEIPHPEDLETDVEKYIYDVFGIEDYKLAIAVFSAESGLREDAININSNNTIDVGIAQINQVHFKKPGCSLKEVSTMKGNIDCAYSIWLDQGWNPWVAFNNGNFKSKL